jgi:hypothetical protein
MKEGGRSCRHLMLSVSPGLVRQFGAKFVCPCSLSTGFQQEDKEEQHLKFNTAVVSLSVEGLGFIIASVATHWEFRTRFRHIR